MAFRVKYWEGHKIATDVISGADCEVSEGMFYILDEAGKTTFSVRRTSLVSAARVDAIKKQIGGEVKNGKGKTAANSGSNVRFIKQSDGQD